MTRCHCERSEAILTGKARSDGDCFVAPLLAITSNVKENT